ncbi:MAG: hypothetical protein HKM24_02030 [Gammaproteobacteria bacterium]|nr:hypothetical protein [Gammaproteobacteria bacterium]
MNKTDIAQPAINDDFIATLCADLDWQGPVYCISAATGAGVSELMQAVSQGLDELNQSEQESAIVTEDRVNKAVSEA